MHSSMPAASLWAGTRKATETGVTVLRRLSLHAIRTSWATARRIVSAMTNSGTEPIRPMTGTAEPSAVPPAHASSGHQTAAAVPNRTAARARRCRSGRGRWTPEQGRPGQSTVEDEHHRDEQDQPGRHHAKPGADRTDGERPQDNDEGDEEGAEEQRAGADEGLGLDPRHD